MLDNLVESKDNAQAVRKLSGFLFSTLAIVSTVLLSATVWSLFAKDFSMGEGDMNLTKLVAPIPVAENAPPPPEPEKPRPQTAPQTSKTEVISRKTNMARVDEAQIAPDKVSTAPNAFKSRPNGVFVIDPNAAESNASAVGPAREKSDVTGPGFGDSKTQPVAAEPVKPNVPKPPPALKDPEEKPKTPPVVSLGVVNGKAASLPKPLYPPPAKAVGASGAVNVQVLIDETGSVISAKAVSGHPLLRQAAERAARQARFTPTLLSKVPVKVNGLIIYNFTR